MDCPISIVVVGGSGLIGKRHISHVAKNERTRLFAIVDPSTGAPPIAEQYSVPLYSSIEEMLKQDERPQAAIVCTPNHTHVPLAIELVNAGIHVLVEKPISESIESAQSLIRAAKEKGVFLLVGHHRRFNPYVLAAKIIVDTGGMGDIVAVNGLWTAFKPSSYFNAKGLEWRSSRSSGGGVVMINMIHEVDLMHYLFGPITKVHAEKTRPMRTGIADGSAIEEGAAIILRFASGVVGTFVVSDHVSSPHHFESGTGENPMMPKTGADVYRILGTEGTLSVPDMVKWSYGEDAPSWSSQLFREEINIPGQDVAPFDRQLDHFVNVVQGRELPNCTGTDGLRAVAVCRALIEALEDGKGFVDIETDPAM